MVLCLLLFFGGQFRFVNYFDSEIVRSPSAYFGKTRSEMGYTLTQVFCHKRIHGIKESFVHLQFYLYCIGKIVNKQRIVCNRILAHGIPTFVLSKTAGSLRLT